MKRKSISVLLALVLAISLSLVTAVPAAADPDTLNVYPLQLSTKNADSTAEWSTTQAYTGSYSAHLDSGTTTAGDGDEARIVIEMPEGTTLNDITSISWWEYNVAGYPPHVDVKVDTDGNGEADDALVFEYAYNYETHYTDEAPMPYGALTCDWYQTFSDDGNGPDVIDDNANAWLSSGPPGPLGDASFIYGTLAEWKAGTVDDSVNGDTAVTALEIEVDNWVVNSEAYVDDIAINSVVWYGRIQDAIDCAEPGDTINVAAGTYTEDLTIDKALTIQGEDASTTTIIGAHTITVSDVSLDEFELDCNGTIGITVDSSANAISGTSITNCIFEMSTATTGSIGIWLGGSTPANAVSDVTMDSNEFYGPSNMCANPWKIGGYYTNSISCEVTNVDFTSNTVDRCSTPINLLDGNLTDILINGNTYTNTDGGVYIWVDSGEAPTGVLSQFVFTNNDLSGTNTYGVAFFGWDGDLPIDSSPFTDANFGAGNAIHYNDFSNIVGGYGLGGVSIFGTFTSYVLDATCNWWGDIAGPSIGTNPYDSWTNGDPVSSDVDYIPWLIQSELAAGWNIWSLPIAPDPESGAQIYDDLVAAGMEAMYYFDSETQFWGTDPSQANSLDAFYIKMPGKIRIRYYFDDEATFPGVKEMAVGWNLVGLAQLYQMHVTDALYDAYWATGQTELVGYSKVISLSLNGQMWTYLRDNHGYDMFPTKGYWVFMVNDGTLGGFTSTPIVEIAP